jgi:hypothetical protein
MVALSNEAVSIGKYVDALTQVANKTSAERRRDLADFSAQENFLARIIFVRTANRHWYASREY